MVMAIDVALASEDGTPAAAATHEPATASASRRGGPSSALAAGRARHAGAQAGQLLDLLGDLERARGGGAGGGLRGFGGGVANQQPPAQLVVVLLVGLDALAVERRGGRVAALLAEVGE